MSRVNWWAVVAALELLVMVLAVIFEKPLSLVVALGFMAVTTAVLSLRA